MSRLLKIGFLGGGKMAQAMANGFVSAGLTKGEQMTASFHPSDVANIEAFKSAGVKTFVDNLPVVKHSEVVFISVKPTIVPTVLENVKSASDGKLFISIAMGVTLKELEKSLSLKARVIRVMPNTPALVRSGASVYVRGSAATADDCVLTQSLLEAIGTCEEVAENMMDPITALSGSGPAYIFVLIEALADGGVRMGLPRDLSYRLASQTVLGSGQLVKETGRHPGQLKDDVTSPAGSTAAGLAYLEQNAFRHAVAGAVEAATLRCRQVSGNK
ncbi:pyrroline-5-carboxylate reductase 1, mitochondrial [Wyeomyia smithii]|uniref:pyrroline-5-carboxylate reductase 1, mitochondrial n=1 Tax=Wyeomyia smithii TaxID=174621 RepID=UPI002467B277|nr:pyrroline-5-carboxylate reductase 1, mitochondrial [Wyeomyia smithii]XP_055528825.1 pyrroline-5-carboxylate reductase 1, mitochondrial [Wyeomyia smithii]